MNDTLSSFLVGLFVTTLIALLVVTPIFLLGYYSSCREAKIYNQQNETNYSCSDFFWAGSQINLQSQTIRLTE